MSGANDPKHAAGAPGGADPSMEDILASIRKILNEDEQQDAAGAPPPGGAPPAAPAGEEPPLVLTEDMLVEPERPEAVAAAPEPAPEPPPPPPEPEPDPMPPPPPAALSDRPSDPTPAERHDEGGGLIAPAAAAAAAASLGALAKAVAQERSSAIARGGPSIEDVVREELRPMLKDWLDSHLPPLVERLVQAEIERVMRR